MWSGSREFGVCFFCFLSLWPPPSIHLYIQHHSSRLGNFSLVCVHLLSSSHFVSFLDVSFAWDSLPLRESDRQTKSDKRKREQKMELGNQIVAAYLVLFLLILLKLFSKNCIQQLKSKPTEMVCNAILYLSKASTNSRCEMLIQHKFILAPDSSGWNLLNQKCRTMQFRWNNQHIRRFE